MAVQDEEAAPKLSDIVEHGPARDLNSQKSRLQAARARSQTRETVDLEIPGYDGTLWATFRALDDYKEADRIRRAHERVRNGADRDLEMAADTLVRCCLDTFVPESGFVADEDHDKFSLGMTLGADLARWLELDGCDLDGLTDAQSVFLIFPNTLQLAAVAALVNQHTALSGRKADQELEGN